MTLIQHRYYQALRQSKIPESKALYRLIQNHSAIGFIKPEILYNEFYRLNLEAFDDSPIMPHISTLRTYTVNQVIGILDEIQKILIA